MTSSPPPIPQDQPADGAAWVARMMSGATTAEDHVACARWRSLSVRNEEDYQRARQAWIAAGTLGGSRRMGVPRWLFPGAAGASAALVLMVAILVFVPSVMRVGQEERSYTSNSAQRMSVDLRYGAEVALNMRSEISVIETREKTSLRLSRGEAFFTVEPGRDRTFVVRAGNAEVTVTGTSFEVAHFPNHTMVAVEHGSVQVAVGQSPTMSLRAGDRALISADGAIRSLSNIPPEIVGAWRDGQLIFVDEPLGLVFDRLQLYTQSRITLAADVDTSLLVSATFASQDIDNVLSGLDDSLPISIERTTTGDLEVLPN